MSNLDKQLDKVLDKAFKGIFVDAWKTEEGIMLDAKYREQIKATILKELEDRVDTKMVHNSTDDDYHAGMVEGHNRAVDDCLAVINKLLGDSNE